MGIIEVFQPEDVNNLPAVSEVATDYKAGNVHRQTAQKAALLMASLEKVVEPAGDQFKKVTWEEYEKMYSDPHFVSRATYEFDLVCFTNGRPRPKPLRPIAQNEVGMYGGKIVYLADRGPGDIGEKLFSVPVSINKETHMIIDDKLVAVGELEQEAKRDGHPGGILEDALREQTLREARAIDGACPKLELPPEFYDACAAGDVATGIAVLEVSISGKTQEEAIESAEAYKATQRAAAHPELVALAKEMVDSGLKDCLLPGLDFSSFVKPAEEDVSSGEAHMRVLGKQIARSRTSAEEIALIKDYKFVVEVDGFKKDTGGKPLSLEGWYEDVLKPSGPDDKGLSYTALKYQHEMREEMLGINRAEKDDKK